MDRNFCAKPHVESLESRDVPSTLTESTFTAQLADGTTVVGSFSRPSTVDGTQQFQSLTLANLTVTINGSSASVSGTPTAEFSYGDLLGVTATASNAGTTVQIDDAIATDGGADAQIGYVSGSASSNSTSAGGGGGSNAIGGGSYSSGSGSISGIVFEDANGNGTFDSGESGTSGVTVELLETSGTVLATTTTNSSGAYSFSDLSDNQYAVEVETTEAFTQPGSGTGPTADSVFDPGTGTAAATIADGQAITGLDAGLYTPVTVEGSVFVDANDSGYFQAPDAVLVGATITLENSDGTTRAVATSDSGGSYQFTDLAPGTYQVAVGQPLGYQFTTENATDNPTVDSGVSASTGVSSTLTLTDGAAPATINAGLTAETGTASISGTISTNATGSSAGAAGVSVQLIDPSTGTILQSTTTVGSGDYSFSGLVAGTYSVTFQSDETISSGGAFDAGTYTASETVTAGQALTGVSASLTVPEQMTFALDGYSGSISYSTPLESIDPTQASQSIPLTDFSITIGSQTFYEPSTSFTTAPSIQYQYGQMEGLTFAFDPSASGLPFSSVSMSGGTTLSAQTNTFPNLNVTTAVAATSPSVGLDFSSANPNYKGGKEGTVDGGQLIVVIVVKPQTGDNETEKVQIKFDQGYSASGVVHALVDQIADLVGVSASDRTSGSINIYGVGGWTLVKVTVSLPGRTTNVLKSEAGGAVCTIS